MTRGRLFAAGLGAIAFVAASAAAGVGRIDVTRLFVFGAALGVAVAVDLAERRIPNRVVLPAAAICGGLSIAAGVRGADLAAGAAVVVLLLTFTVWRPDSFGMGDVKLALLVVLGLDGNAAQGLLLGLAIAAALGVLILIRQGLAARTRALPLAPFIAAGALVALIT